MYAGEPPQAENYQVTDFDGLKVYLPLEARTDPDGVAISLSRFGLWNRLVVTGLRP